MLLALTPVAVAQQDWNRVDPVDFTFVQASLDTTSVSDSAGNRAVEVSAVFRITNDTAEVLEGVRWVWPWGTGYHLDSGQPDQIFERRWNEAHGQFLFYGQDAWYDRDYGVSLTPVGIDGLMAVSDSNLSPNSDAENFAWLGVDSGAVASSEYPDVRVDPLSQVPCYDLGAIAPGASVELTYGAMLEYPNTPIPSQVGFYGLAELVQRVPGVKVLVLAMAGGVLLGRRRRQTLEEASAELAFRGPCRLPPSGSAAF